MLFTIFNMITFTRGLLPMMSPILHGTHHSGAPQSEMVLIVTLLLVLSASGGGFTTNVSDDDE